MTEGSLAVGYEEVVALTTTGEAPWAQVRVERNTSGSVFYISSLSWQLLKPTGCSSRWMHMETSQMSQLWDGELSLRTKGPSTQPRVLPHLKRIKGAGWYMVLAALLLITQLFDEVTKGFRWQGKLTHIAWQIFMRTSYSLIAKSYSLTAKDFLAIHGLSSVIH